MATKTADFFDTHIRWIVGVIVILLLAWTDNRYITHEEKNIMVDDLNMNHINGLISKEEDLRQRQNKKIIKLDELNTLVNKQSTNIAVMENDIIWLKSVVSKLSDDVEYLEKHNK